LKIVQIGSGGWGKNHSRVLSEFGVLSAICDTNPKLAEELGKKYSVNFYDSIENLLEREEFDAALVCTPTSTHTEIASRLIENKKHVFVEKPLTYLSEEGQKLIDTAKKNNVSGWVRNLNDRRVEAILEGDSKSVNSVIEWTRIGPANSRVDDIEVINEEFKNEFSTFEVLY